MFAFDAMREGVQALIERAKERDAARGAVPEGIRVLHASDLGKCPVRLYYELMNYEQDRARGYSRQLFLEDGFTHEDTLRKLLSRGWEDDDHALVGNMQVPAYKIADTNIEIWGEADIVAYEKLTSTEDHVVWVVESKALYHDTFVRYVNDPSQIPAFYFMQLAFYVLQLGARDGGMLVLKDRERSEYYPNPWAESVAPEMCLTLEQARELVEGVVAEVKGMLVEAPSIPENVLDECRFCQFYSTCYSSILVGREHDDPEPLVVAGKTDGLSKNISEAIRLGRGIENQMRDLKAQKSAINEDLTHMLIENGLKKIVADAGTVTRVTRRGAARLTKAAKAMLEGMKKDGTLPTETAPDSHYLRYSKGVAEDEPK